MEGRFRETLATDPIRRTWGYDSKRPPREATLLIRCAAHLSLVAIALVFCCSPAEAGESLDRFETAEVVWQVVDHDCSPRIVKHARTGAEKHSGDLCEMLQFQAGSGTKLLLKRSIPPCRVLRDFAPSLWVKADRSGLRLMALVEFPHEPSPDGKGFVRRLVRGPSYHKVGEWQQLDFAQLDTDFLTLYRRVVQGVRLNTGRPDFDDRDAFVSAIVLDAYGGAGPTTVWTDDLEIEGYVPWDLGSNLEAGTSEVRQVSWQQEAPSNSDSPWGSTGRTGVPRRQESMLIVEDRPFFLKIVDNRGESLESLQNLGFNTVRLSEAPTPAMNQEASRLGLWLISPPPTGYRALEGDAGFTRVLAWSLGQQLDRRADTQLDELSRQLRTAPATSRRLQHADVRSISATASRMLDLVETPMTGELGWSYGVAPYDALADFRDRCRSGVLVIGSMPLEASSKLTQQIAGFAGRVPELETAPESCKSATFQAIAAGARGIAFRTTSRLDGLDAASRRRANLCRWINGWIDRLEPWGAGGQNGGAVTVNRPDWRAVTLETTRTKLILLIPGSNLPVSGDVPELSLLEPGSFASARAYRLTETGVAPLPQSRAPSGGSILVPQRDIVEAIALTQDPLALQHLDRGRSPDVAISQLQLQHEIILEWVAKQSPIHGELAVYRAASREAESLQQQALATAANSERMIWQRNLEAAYASLIDARSRLARSRRSLVDTASAPFTAPQSNPLMLDVTTLPAHWELAQRLRGANWQGSLLAAGDFEDLPHLIRSGWTNDRWAGADETIDLELTSEEQRVGAMALRIRLTGPAGSLNSGTDQATVRLGSPSVQIRAGQIVRIHGWVKVQSTEPQRPVRVWFEDSLGGQGLGRWLSHQPNEWQELTVYRSAFSDETLRLSFDIQGYGSVVLDDVTVHVATPAPVQ